MTDCPAHNGEQPEQPDERKRLLVLVGPTAVGKTKLSIELAKRWNAEIISGDSMQVYRGMDIGTAKITPAEMEGVPHHLIDIHDPDYAYSAAEFQTSAQGLVDEITARGKLPFIVGGTGLYIESVCYGYRFSTAPADEALRKELNDFADTHGEEALHRRLREADPQAAARLHPNDRRRVIRALEIVAVTGKPLSTQSEKLQKDSPYRLCIIGLTMDRQQLYRRIELRIDEMLQCGLIDEVRQLLQAGFGPEHVSMQGLGYKEIMAYVCGEMPLEEAAAWLKQSTRRFAKRQLTWFRRMGDIDWVKVGEGSDHEAVLSSIDRLIGKRIGNAVCE